LIIPDGNRVTQYIRGWEPMYHDGTHELCIIADGLQNQLILC